jgi:hypothetical protein
MHAFLDAANSVIGKSATPYTLTEAQALNSDIASLVANAPPELVAKGEESPDKPYYHRRTSGDGTSIDDYTEITVLLPLKVAKANEIDARTEELIGEGFVASNGKRFTIDDSSLTRYHVLYATRLHGSMVYPVVITTFDGQNAQVLNNSAFVSGFVEEAFLAFEAIIASGSALKQQLIAASTLAEVEAVVDNR